MERRSSLRKQIHHGATVKLPNGMSWQCVIADYCSQGMFLRFSAETSHTIDSMASSIKEQSLTIVFEGFRSGGREYKVIARPARIIPGAMGMKFVDRFDDAIQALEQVSVATQASRSSRSAVSKEADIIVAECIEHVKKVVGPRFYEVYPDIVQALKESAKTASSDVSANKAMDAATLFNSEFKRIHRLFLEGIHNPFSSQLKSSDSKSSAESLSLVSKGEFEDWLITRVLTTKTETLYRGLLLQLRMRLEAIGIDEKDNQNSLGPALVVNAFHHALVAVDIHTQAEKTIYRELEKKVLQKLEDVYVELNNIFVRHNILPNLDFSKHVKKAPARSRPVKPPAADLPPEGQGPIPDGDATLGYDTMVSQGQPLSAEQQNIADISPPFSGGHIPSPAQQSNKSPYVGFQHSQEQAKAAYHNAVGLIKALRSAQIGDEPELPGGAIPQMYSDRDLFNGLASLQSAPLELQQEDQPRQALMDRILESLPFDDADARALPEEKQEAIDVVDRFFVSLKDNPRLSLDAKNHLLKLEIPVLKILLQDANFFEDVASPVHGVMNRIAQLGTKGARLNPASKKKVNAVVQRISEEFEEDTSVFDDAVGELDQIIDRHNTLYKKNVERVAAAADGVHRVHQAKLAVGRALNKRLSQGQIPSSVVTLINEGWRDLLQLTHIKHGPESEEWHRYLKIVDELIHFGNNPESGIDVTAVLSQIHDGLSQLSASDDVAPKVRNELQQMLQAKQKPDVKMVEAELDEDVISEDEQERRNAEKSRYLKQWIRRAKEIEIGSWLQFNKHEEETQYMRLVWVAKAYTKFVFVNHQGMKVIELGLLKIASYLKEGVIVPDPDYDLPIMNQGLDAMVKDVYDKLAHQAGHDKDTGLANKKEFCKAALEQMEKGKSEDSCSILYIRFSSFVGMTDISLSREFIDKVSIGIEECANATAVIGRINDRDFAVFSKNDELDMLNVRVAEVLEQLCREVKDKKKRFVVAVAEARATLGQKNPETLLLEAAKILQGDSASVPVAEVVPEAATEPSLQTEGESAKEVQAEGYSSARQVPHLDVVEVTEASESMPVSITPADEKVAPRKVEPQAEMLVEEGDASMFEEAISKPSISEDVEVEEPEPKAEVDLFAGIDTHLLEIRAQKALSISDDSVHEEQYELGLFVQGRREALSSDDEALAKALDHWWIEQLATPQLASVFETQSNFYRVRVSGFALRDDEWMERLTELVDEGKVKASKVWFDLYKCAVIENIHAAVDIIRNLMAKGFRFCLDQFGSPNTPYALMKYLPVDMIKIDESFVETLNDPSGTEEKAESIVEVAHYFGKEVLASSVDSAICLQKMKKLKVDYVQGRTVSDFEFLVPPYIDEQP